MIYVSKHVSGFFFNDPYITKRTFRFPLPNRFSTQVVVNLSPNLNESTRSPPSLFQAPYSLTQNDARFHHPSAPHCGQARDRWHIVFPWHWVARCGKARQDRQHHICSNVYLVSTEWAHRRWCSNLASDVMCDVWGCRPTRPADIGALLKFALPSWISITIHVFAMSAELPVLLHGRCILGSFCRRPRPARVRDINSRAGAESTCFPFRMRDLPQVLSWARKLNQAPQFCTLLRPAPVCMPSWWLLKELLLPRWSQQTHANRA